MSKDNVEKDTTLQTPDASVKKSTNVDKKDSSEKAKKPSGKSKDDKKKVSVFKRIGRFFRDLKSEFKKIVWPSKKTTLNNTGVVLALMAIVGVAIWVLDWLLVNGFRLIF